MSKRKIEIIKANWGWRVQEVQGARLIANCTVLRVARQVAREARLYGVRPGVNG